MRIKVFSNFSFAHPWFFLLLILVPFYLYKLNKTKATSGIQLKLSNIKQFQSSTSSWKFKLLKIHDFLWLMAFVLMVIALARPQKSMSGNSVNSEGIDIVLSLDISSSMLAKDFKPDRLEAAKQVAKSFIAGRPNDRIGLVVFAGESFTQCPITTDHDVLINLFRNIQSGIVDDGTAIGMGLATAITRLVDSKAKSKVVILMTDGINNAGYIDPISAIELAKSNGVRVYTIGIGSKGKALYPEMDAFGEIYYRKMDVQIDEELLKKVAESTNGKYFRATDGNKLKEIYHNIDNLEKSKIKMESYEQKEELFFPFVGLGIFCLILLFLIKNIFLPNTL
ncbi:MAG: VWA domain-containing protein [Bacteroidetes bacterium]|nr:VWA domain-containing protein [Bacteroidota bacterium]MBK9633292.1 VWA domain-containing protein [Bacteroidota bacterium]MBL0078061.1 VWA domain-containing protein [Bacteroidota bacterium]